MKKILKYFIFFLLLKITKSKLHYDTSFFLVALRALTEKETFGLKKIIFVAVRGFRKILHIKLEFQALGAQNISPI